MTWVDYCIVAVALLSILVGVLRGFTREILSLLTWIIAFAVAALFGDRAEGLLEGQLADPAVRGAVASGLVFFAALMVGAIITHIAASAVRSSRFSGSDRTLGGGVGVLRAAIIVVLFVLVAGRMGASEDRWWQQSAIVPHFTALAHGAETLIPDRWLAWLKPAAVSSSSSSATDS